MEFEPWRTEYIQRYKFGRTKIDIEYNADQDMYCVRINEAAGNYYTSIEACKAFLLGYRLARKDDGKLYAGRICL